MEVSAAVFFYEGKVLLMRRAQGHSAAGGWEYPGGKLELGETGEQCLKRELKEELGIDAVIGDMIAATSYENGSNVIHLRAFQVVSYTGDISLVDHDMMEWVPTDRLLGHLQLPADAEISKTVVEVFK